MKPFRASFISRYLRRRAASLSHRFPRMTLTLPSLHQLKVRFQGGQQFADLLSKTKDSGRKIVSNILSRGKHETFQQPSQADDVKNKLTGRTLRLLLVGKTGSGKSTCGNAILGEEKFKTSPFMTSETCSCQLERAQRNGTNIEVMDSPGLFDTFKSEDEITEIIVRSVAGMEPGPHAVLYVVPIGVRYTREEVFSYNRLKAYLGQDVTNHMIIVLTHGNRLVAEGISIEQYLEEATKEFKEILDECGNRTVVFEKDAKDKTPQIDALLVQAGAVVEANGGRHYRSELTEKIKKDLEEDAKKKVGDQKGSRDPDWEQRRRLVYNFNFKFSLNFKHYGWARTARDIAFAGWTTIKVIGWVFMC